MIRSVIAAKVAPELHLLAPELNSSFVHHTLLRAIHGVGPLPPAAHAAQKQLEEQDGNVDDAIRELIENHTALAAAQGFVTNIGGMITMAVTLPVNITGLALIQCRLVAAIAHVRGYDLDDPRVHNALLLCTLGRDTVKELVKGAKVPGTPMVVATAPAYDPEIDAIVAAEVTSSLVGRVVGKRAAGAVIRQVPIAGGLWGASSDAWMTWHVGRYAARELRPRIVAGELVAGKRPRRARG